MFLFHFNNNISSFYKSGSGGDDDDAPSAASAAVANNEDDTSSLVVPQEKMEETPSAEVEKKAKDSNEEIEDNAPLFDKTSVRPPRLDGKNIQVVIIFNNF